MKRMTGWFAGFVLACMIMASLQGMASAQGTGLSASEKTELAEEFAPYLHLHPDEDYYPVSVDYAISRSSLEKADSGTVIQYPTAVQLAQFTDPEAGYYLDNRMGTIEDDGILDDFLQNADSYPATVHARVTAQNYYGESVYAIQYYFYYPFNKGPLNTHEGDWEMILIVLDSSRDPMFAAYSQHLGGEMADWEVVESTDGHPHVYVALGSHANYYRAYEGSIGVANDECSGSGPELGPGEYGITVLDDIGSVSAEQGWLSFAGFWGDYGDETSGIMGERGPLGPAYQGDRWDSPITWAESLSEANDAWLSANWTMTYIFWILLGILMLALLLSFVGVYLRRKKQGTLGPRLMPLLYIRRADARSVAAILLILALIIGIAGYLLPWYSVSADIGGGDYATPGPVKILETDGIHGLRFTRPEPGAGMVQVVSVPISFAWLMLTGVAIFLVRSIGVAKTRKYGIRLFGRAIGVLVPAIILIVQVSLVGSVIQGYVTDAPPEVMQVVDTVSASPLQGSTTQVIGDYGTTTLSWGIGPGVVAFFIAAFLYFIAGLILVMDNGEYFRPGQKQAQPDYQQPGYYQAGPSQQPYQEYQPAPYGYPPQPAQQYPVTCRRCGNSIMAYQGTQPFQCPRCGEWMYPPV